MRKQKTDSVHGRGASRRRFLQGAALSGGVAITGGSIADAASPRSIGSENSMPTISLGPHKITRLILGGNPIYGHSHFNRLYSQHLIDYHTPERVVELLRAATSAGVNTWQNSYTERTLSDIDRVRDAGIPFNWLCLGKTDWDEHPELIEHVAKRKPIGIAPHGGLAERLNRQKKLAVLTDILKRIRSAGVLVGLSAHDPTLIEMSEERGWDVDYYMCCQYYLTRPRNELEKLIGEVPMGEVYLPSDRDRMLGVVSKASKPCLVYKVLAAGRANLAPAGVRDAFRYTLSRIKPTDAMIVGMFQEFGDQVAMNAQIVRELSSTS